MKSILPAPPAEPFIKIRPNKSWSVAASCEFWDHRELLYFLIWRDLKLRYKQTLLGSLWIVLHPLLLTIVFTFFLEMLGHVPSNGIPYPAFAYAGLIAWTFFTNAVLSSSYSLVNNAQLITKVYFPRIFIPVTTVAVRLFDLIIAAVFLAAMILYYGIVPTWQLLLYPLLVLELTMLGLGAGILTAALYVKYRDLGTFLPVLIQILMFLSPVMYPLSIVPERWRAIYLLNPLAGILENQRAALFGLKFNWKALLVSFISVLLLLIFSTFFFQRTEENLADVV